MLLRMIKILWRKPLLFRSIDVCDGFFFCSAIYFNIIFFKTTYRNFLMNDEMVWIFMVQASSYPCWLLLLLLVVVCLLPDILLSVWECYNLGQGVVVKLVGASFHHYLLVSRYRIRLISRMKTWDCWKIQQLSQIKSSWIRLMTYRIIMPVG